MHLVMLGLLRQVPGEDKSPWKLFLLLAKVWSWITRAIAVLSECMGIVKVVCKNYCEV